jgi:hypothetical protein
MTVLSKWPAVVTAAWSLTYAMLGLYWWAGGDGFPFAPVPEDRRSGSVLEGTPVEVVAPVMTIWGLLGVLVAAAMIRSRRTHAVLLGYGAITAVTLALLLPDYFLIALLVLAPVLVVFAFTGVPGQQDGLGDILYWHRLNLVVLFVGGVLWAVTTVVYRRRARGACVRCGRHPHAGDPSPDRLLRWGRWAVAVAVVAPVPYEITRIAWFLGYPVGITDQFHTMMRDTDGMLAAGVGFAVASILGGVLTHGLVASWGGTFPALDPVVGGPPGPGRHGGGAGRAGRGGARPGRADERTAAGRGRPVGGERAEFLLGAVGCGARCRGGRLLPAAAAGVPPVRARRPGPGRGAPLTGGGPRRSG